VLVGNAEWRQRLVNHRLAQGGIVLFYDGARISDTAEGPPQTDLHDVGVGLRLRLKGTSVLRLDYGWSLTGDGKTALTAGVGHVF
jgi:hemolysin activation/secretion protein